MPIHKGLNGAKFLLSLLVIGFFAYMMVYADKFFLEEQVALINPIFTQQNISDTAQIDLRTVQIVDISENDQGVLQYVVQAGDSLGAIAAKFGTTISHLKKINGIGNASIRPGQRLIVTDEQEGFVYQMDKKMSIRVFAEIYDLNLQELMSLNYIQDDTEILHEKQDIFINISDKVAKDKGLKEPDPIYIPKPVVVQRPRITTTTTRTQTRPTTASNPNTSASTTNSSTSSDGKNGIIAKRTYSNKVSNGFYAGWCTWYASIISPSIFGPVVDGKQDRPFGGNANQRFANAKAAGFSVGQTPRVGAIIVYSNLRSSAGHVGVVREYHPNEGKMIIEDMNYAGKFIVTKRRENTNRSGIIGYIYP